MIAVPVPVPELVWELCATWDSPLLLRNLSTTLSWRAQLPSPNSPGLLPPHQSYTDSLPCRNQHSMKSDATGGDLDRAGIECPNVQWIQPRVRQACYWSQQSTSWLLFLFSKVLFVQGKKKLVWQRSGQSETAPQTHSWTLSWRLQKAKCVGTVTSYNFLSGYYVISTIPLPPHCLPFLWQLPEQLLKPL